MFRALIHLFEGILGKHRHKVYMFVHKSDSLTQETATILFIFNLPCLANLHLVNSSDVSQLPSEQC